MEIDHTYNYDDVFFRMVGVSLAKTLTKGVRWINRFTDKKIRVLVPFYLSLAGSERFVLDAFVDDVVGQRVELNTDQIPRGIITMNSIMRKTDEFSNPNQFLSKEFKQDGKFRKIFSRTKAIPVTINYSVEIVLDNQLDVYRTIEKIMKVLFNYYFFRIDYYGISIDAVLTLPDDQEITIPRDHSLDTDKEKKVSFPLDIQTYYPDFFIDTDDYETCDNDSEINWESLGMIPPSERTDISSEKRVIWDYYIWGRGQEPDGEDKDRNDTDKENF